MEEMATATEKTKRHRGQTVPGAMKYENNKNAIKVPNVEPIAMPRCSLIVMNFLFC